MLKFFRRYNKLLLVTLGSFLMIAFLMPGVDIFRPNRGAQPVGRVDGEVIQVADTQTAAAELQLLVQMGIGQRLPADPLTWVLLEREARQHGIYASDAEVRGFIDDLQEMAQIDAVTVAQNLEVGEAVLHQALRRFLMVDELQQLMFQARRPSEPRLAHFARDVASTASADVVVIDAEHLLDQVDEPSEQEIEAHFEEYRSERPGETEPYGFGYYLPRRVQLEYIAVPLSRVEAAIEIDEVEAQRYYMDNPAAYLPEGEDEGEPLDYREVRDQVYDDLREERARQTQQEIVRWITSTLSRQERELESAGAGYREVPEDYEPLSFSEIADRVQERWGVLPDVIRVEDEWLGHEEVVELEGFGEAYLDASGREYPVEAYVFSAREVEPGEGHPLTALALQVGVASRPVQDDEGARYVFRLLDAEPPREPRELAEVREDVVRDLKRLRAYEMLQQQQDELRLQAVEDGLESLAERYGTTVRELDNFRGRTPPGVGAMQPPDLAGVGRSAAFVDQVFATAQQAQEEAGSLEEADAGMKTAAVALDHQQAVAVARVRDYEPLNAQMYQMFRPQLTPQLWQADMFRLRMSDDDPLDPEAVKRRVGFIDDRRGADDDEEPEEAADEAVAVN